MAGIKPELYQDYIQGRITLEQASGGTAASSWLTGQSYTPPPVNTPYPTGNVAQGGANISARDARIKEKGQQQWSNDPTVAGLEQRNWDIYIESGRWDSPDSGGNAKEFKSDVSRQSMGSGRK
jgi:hypothetical protein